LDYRVMVKAKGSFIGPSQPIALSVLKERFSYIFIISQV